MQFNEEQIAVIKDLAGIHMTLPYIAKALCVDVAEFTAEYEKEAELYIMIESAAMESEKKVMDNVFHLAKCGDPEMIKIAIKQITKRKVNE